MHGFTISYLLGTDTEAIGVPSALDLGKDLPPNQRQTARSAAVPAGLKQLQQQSYL